MSSLQKLERDRTRADLASLNALLAQLTDEDVLMRSGLESRRDELAASIAALDKAPEHTASAALFFGGRPVAGARGVEAEFGGNAAVMFQDLVAKLHAQVGGSLGQRGVVPNKAAATLHITNVVRGSFGFLLEEVGQQFVDTALKTAVDKAAQLLGAIAEPDNDKFQEAVEAVDQRVLATARDFFELVNQSGATFRLVVGDADTSFGVDAVARAADRARSTTVEDAEETREGQLAGFLPDAHQFEFRTEGGTVRGKVDRAIPAGWLAEANRELVNVEAKARFQVKRVRQKGHVVRQSWTLLRIDAAKANMEQAVRVHLGPDPEQSGADEV